MYDGILFPTDGSETAASVFEYALEIATTHDATVYVLNVADTTRDSITEMRDEVIEDLERKGEQVVDEMEEHAATRSVSVVTDVLRGEPYKTIVDYANSSDIDLIVMPTHGQSGLERFLLGSVTERVVNTSTVPVLTVTPDTAGDKGFSYPCHNVLVPTDGSTGGDLALDAGIDFANASDAALHILHVVETASLGIDVRSVIAEEKFEERATEILDAARKTAQEASVEDVTSSIAYGRPSREIRSYIDENDVDVVVLGTRGKTDFSLYALGGVSAKWIRTSPVPVLVVREEVADDSDTTS